MTTYIRVQYPRLFRRRLDIRNRRLKDVAFVQPPVQSLGKEQRISASPILFLCLNLARTRSKAFPSNCGRRIGELPLPVFLLQRWGGANHQQAQRQTRGRRRGKTKGTRTAIIRPGGQRNVDNPVSRAQGTRSISVRALDVFLHKGEEEYAYRSTVSGFNIRVKCCRSSVGPLRHHA